MKLNGRIILFEIVIYYLGFIIYRKLHGISGENYVVSTILIARINYALCDIERMQNI